jgi:hypothetical protein
MADELGQHQDFDFGRQHHQGRGRHDPTLEHGRTGIGREVNIRTAQALALDAAPAPQGDQHRNNRVVQLVGQRLDHPTGLLVK